MLRVDQYEYIYIETALGPYGPFVVPTYGFDPEDSTE